jgi:23S rRNA (cytidine1920-2'-O)/16S rRNA (cytidine1409-2'-O)-methyltransferase
VKDDSLRMGALNKVKDEVVKSGFKIIGEIESPILGSEGNKEFLLYIKKL